MAQLNGDSILFFKVRPGEMRKAVRDLQRSEEISEIDTVLGSYDLVAQGAFEDSRQLSDFIERVESKPFFQTCHARPSYETWKRGSEGGSNLKGWVLVKSGSPSSTVRDLKKIPNVRKVVQTSGDFNIVVNFSVRDTRDWKRTVFEKIHSVTGVRDVVTLPTLPD